MIQKLEKALSRILLYFPCLGYFIYNWQIEESNIVPTVGTTYDRLLYNPEFCEQLSVNELAAVIIHEVVHCMFLHPTVVTAKQAESKIKSLWEIALEMVTNSEVLKILSSANCSFNLPGSAFSPLKQQLHNGLENIYYYDEEVVDLTALEIYKELVEKYKDKIVLVNISMPLSSVEIDSQGSSQSDTSSQNNQTSKRTKTDKGKGKNGKSGKEEKFTCPVCGATISSSDTKCPGCGKEIIHIGNLDRILSDEDKRKIEDAIEKTIAVLEKMKKDIGQVPSGIERFIRRLQKTRVPWTRILLAFLGNIVSGSEEYRWERPNHRHPLADQVIMPGLVDVELDDIVFVVDTSGSMSDTQLAQIAAELGKVAQIVPEVYVITTDAEVHERVKASSLPDLFKKLKFKGGGGTDFCPVFKEVKRCACMVFFTDGYATYPEKPPRYPVLWVLTKDNQTPPFGKVCYVLDV